MNGTIARFARNPIAANLLMGLVLVAGVLTARTIPQEIAPEIKMGMITVTVAYPGATPESVEEGVVIPVEEAIYDIEGVKRVTSLAREGVGTVGARLLYRAESRRVRGEIEARVQNLEDLPEAAEKPTISEVESWKNVINVVVSGDVAPESLIELGERLRDEIAGLRGITRVELANAPPREIRIELSERALSRHGLRFDDVVSAVRSASLDLPGGDLETEAGEIRLRTSAQARTGREFEEIALLTDPDGTRLRLGDVGQVVDGFEDTGQSARFDRVPAVLVQVFRTGDQRALDIAGRVSRFVQERAPSLPPGVSLDVWRDESVPLRARQSIMLENGAYGLLLVLFVLSLFLRTRLAFWIAAGIPVSFLGALALAPLLGFSINVVTLVAFIVALGLVVDDAIVVGEAIAQRQDASGSKLRASVEGAQAVAVPVVVAALTTMILLVPLLFVGGVGQQAHPLPKVVIATLAVSLVEALLVLPAHLAAGREEGGRLPRLLRPWLRLQDAVAGALERTIRRLYRPGVARAVRGRATTLAAAAAGLCVTAGLVAGGWVPFTFLPPVESQYATALLRMPKGTPTHEMERAVRQIEDAADRLRAELRAESAGRNGRVVEHMFTSLGSQPEGRRQSFVSPLSWSAFEAPHLAEVQLSLVPHDERALSNADLTGRWRERIGEIPEAELSFTSALYSRGERLSVQLEGLEAGRLQSASEALKRELERVPGVHDVTSSDRPGKPELRLRLRPEAETLGLSAAELARQVRLGFHGEEAQTVPRGRHEVPVVVRYSRENRNALSDLNSITLRTPSGDEVPFYSVAEVERGRGLARIRRADRRRTIEVSADVDTERVNENAVIEGLEAEVLPRILADHSGVSYSLEGQQREQAEFLATLETGYGIGLLAVFGLLAVTLRSYLLPFLVVLAVPFGVVGAVLGHGLLGIDLTMYTVIGIVGVTGVVVNDALVLLHGTVRRREEGEDLVTAAVEGAADRFRPVLLTTLTTVLGLTPILLERSTFAQDLKPMAIALAFGELVSTAVVLFVVPAAWVAVESRSALRAEPDAGDEASPADPSLGPPPRPGRAAEPARAWAAEAHGSALPRRASP